MKKCPVCQSVVNEEFECPICHTTLTDEPACAEKREKYAKNRFYLRYLAGQCWFSLVALGVVLVMTLLTDRQPIQVCLAAWGLVAISLLFGIFRRGLIKLAEWKYSQGYACFSVTASKYATAGLAMFAAIMMIA